MKRVLVLVVLVALGAALIGAAITTMNMAYAEQRDPKHSLKCDNETDSCVGFCSTANVKGDETTFCFTAKECHKFQRMFDGTKCKKTIIHD
jgi:hypothetical protein